MWCFIRMYIIFGSQIVCHHYQLVIYQIYYINVNVIYNKVESKLWLVFVDLVLPCPVSENHSLRSEVSLTTIIIQNLFFIF